MDKTLNIITGLNALLNLALDAGINFAQLQEMRAQSEDGHLTDEQVQQLAAEARQAVEGM